MKISYGAYGAELAPAAEPTPPPSGALSTVALAITGGGAGFLFGGPIGAVIGVVAGGVIGSKVKPAAPMLPPGASAQVQQARVARAANDLRAAGAVPVSTDACLELCAKKADQLIGALRVAQGQIESLTAENAQLKARLNGGGVAKPTSPPTPQATWEDDATWRAQQEKRSRSAASKAVIDMCTDDREV